MFVYTEVCGKRFREVLLYKVCLPGSLKGNYLEKCFHKKLWSVSVLGSPLSGFPLDIS